MNAPLFVFEVNPMRVTECSMCRRPAAWIDTEVFCEGHKEKIIGLGTKSSRESLLIIASSKDPQEEGMAYAGLLYLRNYSLLRQAIRFAQAPTNDPIVLYWQSRIGESIGVIGDNRFLEALEATHRRKAGTKSVPLSRPVLRNPPFSSKNASNNSFAGVAGILSATRPATFFKRHVADWSAIRIFQREAAT